MYTVVWLNQWLVVMFCSRFLRPVLAALLVFAPLTSQAQNMGENAQLHTFATCAGRLSAVVEYEWLAQGAPSAEAQKYHDDVIALVAAIISEDQSRSVLQWRRSAKQAQFDLLLRTETPNPDDAAWAANRARQLTQECTALLL